jgi:hypothetical protein
LSRSVADDLSQLRAWSMHLRDCGERIVKHGQRVHIFNLYTGEVGNPACPRYNRTFPSYPWSGLRLVALLLIIAAVFGTMALVIIDKLRPTPVIVDVRTPDPERLLSYSFTVQKDPKRYPGSTPSLLSGEPIFKAGDQVRLNVSSSQAGYLYIINEGPAQSNGLPDFNVLFPSATTNGGSAEIKPYQPIQIPEQSQRPDQDWFFFDEQEGEEKIWLVWSERLVPELEAVKGRANPRDRGVINDKNQIESVAQYLARHSASKPEVKKDEITKQLTLKSKGEVLVGLMKLEHH